VKVAEAPESWDADTSPVSVNLALHVLTQHLRDRLAGISDFESISPEIARDVLAHAEQLRCTTSMI
jgi:hypothetical protein